MPGASEILSTSDLLSNIRSRLTAQVSGSNVLDRMGDEPGADSRHKAIRIEEVRTEAPPTEDTQRPYTIAPRTVRLRWWYAARSDNDDGNVADWAASIREALTGSTTWAHTYKIRFAGEPVALSRVGGYYTGELEITSHRGLSVG